MWICSFLLFSDKLTKVFVSYFFQIKQNNLLVLFLIKEKEALLTVFFWQQKKGVVCCFSLITKMKVCISSCYPLIKKNRICLRFFSDNKEKSVGCWLFYSLITKRKRRWRSCFLLCFDKRKRGFACRLSLITKWKECRLLAVILCQKKDFFCYKEEERVQSYFLLFFDKRIIWK